MSEMEYTASISQHTKESVNATDMSNDNKVTQIRKTTGMHGYI